MIVYFGFQTSADCWIIPFTPLFPFKICLKPPRCTFSACWNQWMSLLLQASPFGLVFCHIHEIQWTQISENKNLLKEAEEKNNVHLTSYNKNIFLCLFRLLLLSSLSFFLHCIALHCIAIEKTHSETHWPYIHAIWYRFYTNTHTHILRVSLVMTFFFFFFFFSSMHMHDFTPYIFYGETLLLHLSIYSIGLIHSKSQGSRCCKDASKRKKRERERDRVSAQ